jgi:hypothetical protein
MSDEVLRAGAARGLSESFPGVVAWYGKATRSWWAMVPLGERGRLVEAINPVELRKAIVSANAWPWPRP